MRRKRASKKGQRPWRKVSAGKMRKTKHSIARADNGEGGRGILQPAWGRPFPIGRGSWRGEGERERGEERRRLGGWLD